MTDSKNQFFLNKFKEEILTQEDLIFLLEEISVVEKLIFKKINISLSEKAKENISEKFIEKLKELEKEKIISINPENNRIFFEKLKKYLQELNQIKIIIGFQPQKKFIDKVSSWLEKELKQKLILNLILNPEIVAGAIIEYQGKQIDFSLIKEIEKLRPVSR
jgi:F0F1-type ATP synthase delta subunit